MSTSKKTKYLSAITYCIALVCIIIGLVFPVNGFSDWDSMLVLMLPSALSLVLGTFGLNVDFSGVGKEFTPWYGFTADGANLMAFAIVLLAIIAVVGIVLLIPVFVSKRDSKVAAGCSYTIEVLAAIVLVLYTLMNVYMHTYYGAVYALDWSIIGIALGGTLLMLVIQSIGNKGASGVAKLIMAILGAIAVVALLNLPALISGLDDSVGIGSGIAVLFTNGMSGLDSIHSFFFCLFTEGASVNYLIEFGDTALVMATAIVLFATAILVVVNFIIDVICLGCNTTKGSTVFDVIRYLLEIVAAIVSIVLVFVMKVDDFKPGLLLYVVLVAAVLQLVISSARCAVFKKKEDVYNYTVPSATTCYDDTTPIIPVYQPTYSVPAGTTAAVAPAPAPASAYAPAPAPAPAPTPAASNYAVYSGPVDAFIARLSEPEKIEFAQLFIQKINGPYNNIPDYVVGGDNKEFFTSLFVYLGRFRPMISDGLMNKIYNELNLLS